MNLKNILLNLNNENLQLLYENYKNPIFLFVLSIVKNYDASEDITEEVFLRIMKYYKSYDQLKNPKTWMFTIAKNTAFTYLKNNKEISFENEKLEIILNKYNSIQNNDSLMINEYLSNLSDIDRNIVILHIFGGLKHFEIAKILNLRYSQVRTHYSYALKKMKEKIIYDK